MTTRTCEECCQPAVVVYEDGQGELVLCAQHDDTVVNRFVWRETWRAEGEVRS